MPILNRLIKLYSLISPLAVSVSFHHFQLPFLFTHPPPLVSPAHCPPMDLLSTPVLTIPFPSCPAPTAPIRFPSLSLSSSLPQSIPSKRCSLEMKSAHNIQAHYNGHSPSRPMERTWPHCSHWSVVPLPVAHRPPRRSHLVAFSASAVLVGSLAAIACASLQKCSAISQK